MADSNFKKCNLILFLFIFSLLCTARILHFYKAHFPKSFVDLNVQVRKKNSSGKMKKFSCLCNSDSDYFQIPTHVTVPYLFRIS